MAVTLSLREGKLFLFGEYFPHELTFCLSNVQHLLNLRKRHQMNMLKRSWWSGAVMRTSKSSDNLMPFSCYLICKGKVIIIIVIKPKVHTFKKNSTNHINLYATNLMISHSSYYAIKARDRDRKHTWNCVARCPCPYQESSQSEKNRPRDSRCEKS